MEFQLFDVFANTILITCTLSAAIGIFANGRNLFVILLSAEIVFIGNFLFLLIHASMANSLVLQVFALFLLVIAAAESAVVFSILANYFRS